MLEIASAIRDVHKDQIRFLQTLSSLDRSVIHQIFHDQNEVWKNLGHNCGESCSPNSKNDVSHLALARRRIDVVNGEIESLSVAPAAPQIASEAPSSSKVQVSTLKASKVQECRDDKAMVEADTISPETLESLRDVCPFSLMWKHCPLEKECKLRHICGVRRGPSSSSIIC